VILDKNGGAYAKMSPPFKIGLGAAIGSGKQVFPWVHINDVVGIFLYAISQKNLEGTYNAVAGEYTTNEEFSKKLAQSLNKAFFLPNVPKFVLNMAMGESSAMVTEGLKISNEKIKHAGYKFQFPKVEDALIDLAT
jgi:uncharacterized protein